VTEAVLDASVVISTPPGWSVTSADWSGGDCPVVGQPTFNTTGSSAQFTATGQQVDSGHAFGQF